MGSSNETNRIRVTLAGAEYTLRGQASEQRLFEVARMVDHIMHSVSDGNPNLDTKRVAVLTALNVADEFLKLKDQYEELLALLEEQTRNTPGR